MIQESCLVISPSAHRLPNPAKDSLFLNIEMERRRVKEPGKSDGEERFGGTDDKVRVVGEYLSRVLEQPRGQGCPSRDRGGIEEE